MINVVVGDANAVPVPGSLALAGLALGGLLLASRRRRG
jgi:MYXO-CTERM domain-containing protein